MLKHKIAKHTGAFALALTLLVGGTMAIDKGVEAKACNTWGDVDHHYFNAYYPGYIMYSGMGYNQTVKGIQEQLNVMSWSNEFEQHPDYDCGTADGYFGTRTKNAVIAFQNANGLTADGIVGYNTYRALAAHILPAWQYEAIYGTTN